MRYSTRPQGQLVEGETFQEIIRDGKKRVGLVGGGGLRLPKVEGGILLCILIYYVEFAFYRRFLLHLNYLLYHFAHIGRLDDRHATVSATDM
jgi:hypothetical protein